MDAEGRTYMLIISRTLRVKLLKKSIQIVEDN